MFLTDRDEPADAGVSRARAMLDACRDAPHVRVFATINKTRNMVPLVAQAVVPVPDYNEVYMHRADVIAHYLFCTRGLPPAPSGAGDNYQQNQQHHQQQQYYNQQQQQPAYGYAAQAAPQHPGYGATAAPYGSAPYGAPMRGPAPYNQHQQPQPVQQFQSRFPPQQPPAGGAGGPNARAPYAQPQNAWNSAPRKTGNEVSDAMLRAMERLNCRHPSDIWRETLYQETKKELKRDIENFQLDSAVSLLSDSSLIYATADDNRFSLSY
jgi:hypothetical protein